MSVFEYLLAVVERVLVITDCWVLTFEYLLDIVYWKLLAFLWI